MKRTLLLGTFILLTASLHAQDLETIIKKQQEATGAGRLASVKTVVIEGSLTQMGIPMEIKLSEKRPGKMKTIAKFGEMEIVQVLNGPDSYSINPMLGSSEPVSMTPAEMDQMSQNSILGGNMEKLLKAGRLQLTGSSEIAGEPAFEIKSVVNGMESFIYISKKSYYTIAVKLSASQAGQNFNVEMRMKDFRDINGVKIASTIDTYVNGSLSGTVKYKDIKFDLPLPDSEFEKK